MGKVFINEFSFGGNIHNNRTEAIPRNPATAPAGLATPRQWQVQPLDFDIPADTICPITYEPIDAVNDGVYKCITCHNLIGFNAFCTWLATNANGGCCPLCRSRDIGDTYYKRMDTIPKNNPDIRSHINSIGRKRLSILEYARRFF